MSDRQRPAGAQRSANEIFAAAAVEKVERQRVSVENAKKHAPITRGRIVALCTAIAIPIFISVVAINVFGMTPASLFETPPSPEAARLEAQRTLETLVADIEVFRKNHNELPESLVEVGVPPRGSWTYAVAGDGYRIRGSLYGQRVAFDATAAPAQGTRIAKELVQP